MEKGHVERGVGKKRSVKKGRRGGKDEEQRAIQMRKKGEN